MPFPPNLPGPGPFLPFREVPATAALAAEPVETFAAQPGGDWYVGEIDQDTAEVDGYFAQDLHASAIEVPAVLIPPPDAIDLTEATQWDNDGYLFDADEDWHAAVYGFPDPNGDSLAASLFPPDVTVEFFADGLKEQPWFEAQDIDTELQNESTLDVTAVFFPPDVTTDFLATQPLQEQPWFGDQETEDYGNPSDDIVPQLFPPTAQDDSYVAALDLPDQVDWSDPDWRPDAPVDQLEGFLSPNDAFDTTIATQPHYGELPIPPEETEDYLNTATVDTSWAMDFASGDEITIATEPLSEQPWFEAQDIDLEADNDTAIEVAGQLVPPGAPDEVIAAQPLADQPWFPEEDLSDANAFIEQNEAFGSIPVVSPDPVLAAVTEYRDGMGEFIPLDEEPTQPLIAELWQLFPPSSIPPIAKLGLWRPVIDAIGKWDTVGEKVGSWDTNNPPSKKGLWRPAITKRGLWEHRGGIGSIP